MISEAVFFSVALKWNLVVVAAVREEVGRRLASFLLLDATAPVPFDLLSPPALPPPPPMNSTANARTLIDARGSPSFSYARAVGTFR